MPKAIEVIEPVGLALALAIIATHRETLDMTMAGAPIDMDSTTTSITDAKTLAHSSFDSINNAGASSRYR